jgi:hypothetical protein
LVVLGKSGVVDVDADTGRPLWTVPPADALVFNGTVDPRRVER